MKKFLIKTIILSIIPVFFAFATIFVFKYKANNIKVDELTHILILGDSHTQSGIDDSIIKNSLNISQSSEHFLYSYNVLKLLLNNNSQIDKVILGVSFHSFGKSYDKYIQDEDKTTVMFPRYFPILDLESMIDIKKVPLKQGKNIIKSNIKSLFKNSTIHNYSFLGSFYKSNRSNLNDTTINAAAQRHYFTDSGNEQEYSEYQVKYLNKMVELCATKNIELIIINTPIHYKYYKKIPEKFLTNYYSTIQQFNSEIDFYDFHSVEFTQDSYGDGDHLNSIGAKKLSLLINERIEAGNKARTHNNVYKK
jgi:RNase H-fold protein (predicted Holliday junction resolvase)